MYVVAVDFHPNSTHYTFAQYYSTVLQQPQYYTDFNFNAKYTILINQTANIYLPRQASFYQFWNFVCLAIPMA